MKALRASFFLLGASPPSRLSAHLSSSPSFSISLSSFSAISLSLQSHQLDHVAHRLLLRLVERDQVPHEVVAQQRGEHVVASQERR